MATDLSRFDVSPETGFVPISLPLTALPDCYFSEWEKVLGKLPDLIKTKQLRNEVDALPVLQFNDSTLRSEEEWQFAHVLLGFLAQAYLWMDGESGLVHKLPKKMAVPWFEVSKHLGMLPVITYANVVLYNYGLRDPAGPISASNLYFKHSFTGTSDESWFYVVHFFIELAAVPGLNAMIDAFDYMTHQDHAAVEKCLKIVKESLHAMLEELNKMDNGCDQKTYFVTIRSFFAGSKGLDAFPDGIIYEGVDEKPLKYHGASGAQSSTVYAFDIFLGREYSDKEDREFVTAMRHYMPRKHREFLETLKDMPSVRDYCRKSKNRQLISSYNAAIDKFVHFRNGHIVLVARYLFNQKAHSINPALDEKGTGGTQFSFLKRVRDETEALKINNDFHSTGD